MSRRTVVKRSIPTRSLVTLQSDFGLRDAYVAEMKAAILRHAREAILIDITHDIPRHDVLCGSITLERAVDGFFPGVIHVAVVDPGVGTDRRILVVELKDQVVICPDNGLITWALRRHAGARTHALRWRPKTSSNTFHGRDIMAPAAAMLATGAKLSDLAEPIDDPVLLGVAPAANDCGAIIHIDLFGNVTTNVPYDQLRGAAPQFKVRGKTIGRLKRTYGDVAPGKPLALIGSSGLLEIAVRDGSAAKKLKLRVGDEIEISR